MEVIEIMVPIHLPNSIPEISNNGEPKPSSVTQTIEKIKKRKRLIKRLLLENFSRFV